MSTKIYNGFRFDTSSLLVIHDYTMAWRKRVVELTKEAEGRFLARLATEQIDQSIVFGKNRGHPLVDAQNTLWNRQAKVKSTQQRDPVIDFECSFTVMPFEDRIYGILYCEQNDWREEFFAQPWVENYWYWDNTDHDEDVSEDEWEERGRIWEALIQQDPGFRPSGCGFTAECDAPPNYLGAEEVLTFIPALDERVTGLTRDSVFTLRMDQLREKAQSENTFLTNELRDTEKRAEFDQTMSRVWKVNDWMKTDEGRALIAQERERIAPLLPEIKKDLLFG